MNKWADLWESHVRAGKTPEQATALVQQAQQDEAYKPTGPKIAAESTLATRDKAPQRADADWSAVKGAARQVGHGATFGFADEIEAGARRVLPLSPSDHGKSYEDIRNGIRDDNQQFTQDHPYVAIGANIAGGALTGGALLKAAKSAPVVARALNASGLVPKAEATATMGQRIGAGMKAGMAAGALSGAGVADEMGDVGKGVVAGGVGGALAGGVFSGAAELIRSGRNALGSIGQRGVALTAGPIRSRVRADAPDVAGARRVLSTMGRTGKKVDDLAAWNATADAPDILAEGIGERGIRDLRTARSVGHAAPDQIETGLTTRARGEVDRVRQAVRDAIGEPVDDEAYKVAKRLEAQTSAAPVFDQAIEGVKISDPRVVDLLQRPSGGSAYDATVRGFANRGQSLPSRAAILKGASPAAEDVASVPLRGASSKTDGMTEEAVLGMDKAAMRSYRPRVTAENIGKLSDKDLSVEHAYLSQMQGEDAAKAAIRDSQEYAEYFSLKAVGNHEDARGLVEQMGYDPATFADQVARDAAGAAKRMNDRAPLLERLQAEMERRGVAPEMPADAATTASRSVAGRGAVSVPERGGELPTLDAKAIQRWKLELDDEIARLEGKEGGSSSQRMRELVGVRDEVENLLYEHANKAEDGSSLWGQAQRTYAKPMQEAEGFARGQRVGRTMYPADKERLMTDPHAESVAKGVGNTLHEDLARLQEGDAGRVQNPAPVVMGSERADARLAVATRGNEAAMGSIRRAGTNAANRLRTRQIVTGGSQTADKLSDIADQSVDPAALIRAAQSPLSAITSLVGRVGNGVQRQLTGANMDEAAKLLMAGLPGQMTRQEAIDALRRMEPALIKQLERQLVTRGATSGAAVRQIGANGR